MHSCAVRLPRAHGQAQQMGPSTLRGGGRGRKSQHTPKYTLPDGPPGHSHCRSPAGPMPVRYQAQPALTASLPSSSSMSISSTMLHQDPGLPLFPTQFSLISDSYEELLCRIFFAHDFHFTFLKFLEFYKIPFYLKPVLFYLSVISEK